MYRILTPPVAYEQAIFVFQAVFRKEKPVNTLKMASFKYLARSLLIYRSQTKFVHRHWEKQMSKANSIMDYLEAGIRAESLRQKAIANNVANLETQGYRRIDVKFEELLAKALDSPGGIDLSEIKAEIYQPKETPVKSNGNDVNLETEVGEMIKNTLRHKAYIRVLNKKFKQIELAINIK